MVAVEAQSAGLPVLASSAVPRECVVIPQLVEFLPLGDPMIWLEGIEAALQTGRLPTDEAARLVRQSAFSIENSADALARIYQGGDPPGTLGTLTGPARAQ